MAYLQFDKKELINLEYSLHREILRSNRAGSYACSTLSGCNTRKYHGLLVCPMEHLDGFKHVLLSSLDLTIISDKNEFNLGIHKYEGEIYNPTGHKYIQTFEADLVPKTVFRVGSVKVLQESLLVEKEQQMLIRYTVLEADQPIQLKFTPFMAFRNVHQLSKANLHAVTKVKRIENGIKSRLYDGYPYLHMQLSKQAEFVHVPDWYYNIEYIEEKKRGYDYTEDLFVPGFFEANAKEGEQIIFSASVVETKPTGLKRKFTSELNKRIARDTYKNCLLNSAEQFIVHNNNKKEVVAGFPWYESFSFDTFKALPGLTLPREDYKTFFQVIDTQLKTLKRGLFPKINSEEYLRYEQVDTPLWFIWCLQQYTNETGKNKDIWKKYSKSITSIFNNFLKGTDNNIHITESGLLYAGEKGIAPTWMDSVVNGKPVTERMGFAVEVNALWYNALKYTLLLANEAADESFIKKWQKYPLLVEQSFVNVFWDSTKAYLADFVTDGIQDWSIRPNQIIATSLDYSPLSPEQKNAVIETVKRFLLTQRGLRTLSPKNQSYKGVVGGDQDCRDGSYHQGTVWPWLLEPYCESILKLQKKSGIQQVKKILKDLEPAMSEHGIGAISEIYDGDPPHLPRGTISQAISVAAVVRIIDSVERLESE